MSLFPVADRHVGQRDGIVVLRVAGLAEGHHARLDDLLHRGAGWLEVVAGVELRRILGERLADGARRRQAQVRIDVDLPHAVLYPLLDLAHRHAPRGIYLPAILVDDVHELFGDARRAVHDEVRGREPLVDLLDDVHGEYLAVGLLGELVGPVARPDGDRQGIHPRPLHELHRLIRVRQIDLTGAHVVLYTAEGPELALHRDAGLMGHLDHLARDPHVVLEIRRGLAIVHERTVHHDAGETELDGAPARLRRVAVVLVQGHGDLRIHLRSSLHQMVEKAVVGILTRPPRGLDNDGRLRLPRRIHNSLYLLQIIDVESPNAILTPGRLIQKLTHSDQCHKNTLPIPSKYQTRHRDGNGKYRRFPAQTKTKIYKPTAKASPKRAKHCRQAKALA